MSNSDIKNINLKKYLKAPTADQVREHIKELGVSALQYERFFGMPYRTINQVYKGVPLTRRFWHIVYEKIKPAYGVGYFNPNEVPGKKKKEKKPSTVPRETNNSVLLNKLKENLK